MAVITLTGSAVLKSDSADAVEGIAGATIQQGNYLYKDAADNKLKLADATSAAKAAVVGMAITGASDGQPVKYVAAGDMTVDNTAVGAVYVISATAGKMCLVSDLVSGNFVTIVGGGKTATSMRLAITQLGVAVPA